MQWQGLKIPVIIISLLAGMALIFAAQWLYQKYSFQKPLNTTLSNNKSIESFQVAGEGRLLRISVSIGGEADLIQSYKEIRKDVTAAAGRRQFLLVLNDSRDDVLNQVWYNSQYAVYQAIVQGSFQEMAEVVNREARTSGAVAKVYVDQENVYLRLTHQGHTLDEVIPRGAGKVQAPVAGGGASAQGS